MQCLVSILIRPLLQVVDEIKKALSGVLVSLSSASFRSNNFTDASGVLTYTSLVRTIVTIVS